VSDTVAVEELVAIVNRRNRFSKDLPLVRQGWNSLTEDVLLMTGKYKGSRLLGPDEVPAGEMPGLMEGGRNGDRTRRFWRL
jgi:hypothetical protein